MRRALPIVLLVLAGCMSRSGVVDCTTGRAYPGFSKPLCGGPFDPFVWLMDDCDHCAAGRLKCAYTPYGGRTCCGEEMVYTPSCIGPPLQWAPPATPSAPGGHNVIAPTVSAPEKLPSPPPPPISEMPDSQENSAGETSKTAPNDPFAPLLDARLERPGRDRR